MEVVCGFSGFFDGKFAIIPRAELICLHFKNAGKIAKPVKLFRDTMLLFPLRDHEDSCIEIMS